MYTTQTFPALLRRAARAGLVASVVASLVSCGPPKEEVKTKNDNAVQAPPRATITAPDGRAWRKLDRDGLHDPANESITYLQQPAEALATLPPGGPNGNQVDWMEALRSGYIQPRTNIYPETNIRTLDLDIVFKDTAGMPYVVFPHRQHTAWLDCKNCHDTIFVARRGANDFGMLEVLQGEFCGRCHGAVSFPLTECKRCHSRDKHEEVVN